MRWLRLALTVPLILVLSPATGSAGLAGPGYFTYVHTPLTPAPARSQVAEVARCPQDLSVIGGGVFTTGASLEDELATSAPWDGSDADNRPDDGWIGEVNVGRSAADVVIYATCAPFSHVKYPFKSAVADPGERAAAGMDCLPDHVRLGGGVRTGGTSTKVTLARTVPAISFEGYGGWRAAVNNGSQSSKEFRVYAICRRASVSAFLSWDFDEAPPGQTQSASGDCGDAYHAVSGGAGMDEGGLAAELNSIYPTDGDDFDEAPEDRFVTWTNNETTGNVNRRTGAVCAP